MSHREVKSAKPRSPEIDLLTAELEVLTDDLVALRREHRAEVDRLTLELEAIKQFLAEAHPDLRSRFHELSEQVRLEVNPE